MGLLNVLFKPTGNSTFKTNSNANDIVNYLIDVALERPLSLPVLQALPSEIGGSSEGVKAANSNPNREPIILWTTIAIFLFLLICIITLQFVNCCCCCGRKDEAFPKRALRRLQMAAVDAEFANKSLVCRITYLILMAISLLFLIACVALIGIYFCSINMVVTFIQSGNDSTSPNTLQESLKSAVNHITTFLDEGINSGEQGTTAALNSFTKQVQWMNNYAKDLIPDTTITNEMERYAVMVCIKAKRSNLEIAGFLKVARSFGFKIRKELLNENNGDELTTSRRKQICKLYDSLRTPEFITRVHDMTDENLGKSMHNTLPKVFRMKKLIEEMIGDYVWADPTEVPTVMRTQFPALPMKEHPLSSNNIRLHPIKLSKSTIGWMAGETWLKKKLINISTTEMLLSDGRNSSSNGGHQ
ncbi:hypothetical protein ACTXT7_016539 [Hymenolepis weldensis]